MYAYDKLYTVNREMFDDECHNKFDNVCNYIPHLTPQIKKSYCGTYNLHTLPHVLTGGGMAGQFC